MSDELKGTGRRKQYLLLAAAVILLVAAFSIWQFLASRATHSTDSDPHAQDTHHSSLITHHASLEPTPELPWFEDVAKSAGLGFVHFDAATPMHSIRKPWAADSAGSISTTTAGPTCSSCRTARSA